MKSNEYTLFEIEHRKYYFNRDSFVVIFNGERKHRQVTAEKLYEELALELHLSPEAIKNWRKGYNGPSTLEIIQEMATFFKMTDWKILLKEAEEKQIMDKYSERQLDAIRRVYVSIIDFLNDFYESDGFVVNYLEFDPLSTQLEFEETIEQMVHDISRQLDREYLDLKNTNIYSDFKNYICDVLSSFYDEEMIAYAKRFTPVPCISTQTYEYYIKAKQSLEKIIDAC